MGKLMCFLFCCSCSLHCLSQSQPTQDSTITPLNNYNPKENIKNKIAADLNIYPNPAKNKITLQVKNFDPGMATVKILDTKGKLVREDSRLITNGTEDIIMFLMLKAGIYFILVSEPGKIARKKLVIL